MYKVHKKIEYAFIALKHMANLPCESMVSVKEMVEIYGAPFDVLSRVMQLLSHAGIVESTKGFHGGYVLKKDLRKVSYLELAQTIQGPMHVVQCLEAGDCQCAMIDSCNVISPMLALNQKISEFFTTVSVHELIQMNDKQELQIKKHHHTQRQHKEKTSSLL